MGALPFHHPETPVLQMRILRHSKIMKFPRPHGERKIWDSDTGKELVPFITALYCLQKENIRVSRDLIHPNSSPLGNPGPGKGGSVHKATQGLAGAQESCTPSSALSWGFTTFAQLSELTVARLMCLTLLIC